MKLVGIEMGTKYKCHCCGGDQYKPVNITTNKQRYKTVKKKSRLTTVLKIRRTEIQVSKDFAECLSCQYRTLLNETESVLPKETKKEIAERLAQTKFDGHFLDPGVA